MISEGLCYIEAWSDDAGPWWVYRQILCHWRAFLICVMRPPVDASILHAKRLSERLHLHIRISQAYHLLRGALLVAVITWER